MFKMFERKSKQKENLINLLVEALTEEQIRAKELEEEIKLIDKSRRFWRDQANYGFRESARA